MIFHLQLEIVRDIPFDCRCPHKAARNGGYVEGLVRGTSKGSATDVLAGKCEGHRTRTPSRVALSGEPVVDENGKGNDARATGKANVLLGVGAIDRVYRRRPWFERVRTSTYMAPLMSPTSNVTVPQSPL